MKNIVKVLGLLGVGMASLQAADMSDVFHSALQAATDIKVTGTTVYDEADGTVEATGDSSTITDGTNGGTITRSGTSRVAPNDINWPDVDSPSPINGGYQQTVSLSPGTYSDVSIGSQGKLEVSAGTYYIRKLTFNDSAEIVMPATGTVQLMVRDSSSLSNVSMNCDSNKNPAPSNKLVYHTGGDITYNSQACVSGFVHAEGKITFTSPVYAYGGFSAEEFEIGNNSEIHNRIYELSSTDFGPICETNTCPMKMIGGKWHMVGISADVSGKKVSDVFGDDFNDSQYTGSSNDTWRVYKREYDGTTNDSSYTMVPTTGGLTQGNGYWLGNKNDTFWDLGGLSEVNWNTTCPNDINNPKLSECLTIDLEPASDNGTPPAGGPYRYFLTGYMGLKAAKWEDFRFVIDGGSPITPSAADTAGWANKQIWKYDESSGQYVTCDDGNSGCIVNPHEGFWIELNSTTAGLNSLQLIIPNGGV